MAQTTPIPHDDDADERLVARLRAGDPAAFESIHARYRRPLVEYAARRLGVRRQDAEDIVQEAFASAYRALIAGDGDVLLRPWLYRIVHNRVVDELRRPLVAIPVDEIPSRGGAPDVLETAAAREELAAVVGDIAALPARQRSVLVGQTLADEPHEVLAARMGTSVGATKNLLNRARMSLHEARRARRAPCAAAA